MERRIRFTRKVIDALPACPAESKNSEVEYSSMESPPGLRLVVTKRAMKSWLYRFVVTVDGRSKRRAIKLGVYPGMDPAEACSKALELRALIAQGIDPLEERDQERKEPTLDQFFQNTYWPHYVQHRLRSASDVESRWRLHLSPVFGQLRFSELKTAAVLAFHNRQRLDTCAASANRLLALLKRLINVAIQHELCDRNVARVRMHPEDNIRNRTLTVASGELARFLASLAAEPNRVVADYLFFSLATAGRREECLQATWAEISIAERLWRIPAARCKSGKARSVPLSDVALEVLKRRAEVKSGEYVFPGKDGGHLVNPTRAWKRIIARAGITDLKIHDLRRTSATLLINHGGSISQAQLLLGHSSSTLTATRYAFLGESQIRAGGDCLGGVLTDACNSSAG